MKRKLLAVVGLLALLLAVPSAAGACTDGSVSVTKAVAGDLAPSDATYTVKLEKRAWPFGWVQIDGVRTLHAGQTGAWNNLNDGDYRLVETTTGDFTATWTPSATFTVSNAHKHYSMVVTNDYGNAPRGSITVTKEVVGSLAPAGASFEVELFGPEGASMGVKSVADGESATWGDLLYGTYTLVEAGDDGYTATFDPSDTVVLGEERSEVSVLLTNDFGDPEPTGSVTVSKVVTGTAAHDDAAFEISLVQVLDGENIVVGTRTLRAGEETTWSELAYGNYRIVESATAGVVVSFDPAADVVVGAETPDVSVVVTNAYGDVTPPDEPDEPDEPAPAPTPQVIPEPESSQVAAESATAAPAEELPYTGMGVWITLTAGLVALAMGLALVRVTALRGRAY